jgi:hypothetical protein
MTAVVVRDGCKSINYRDGHTVKHTPLLLTKSNIVWKKASIPIHNSSPLIFGGGLLNRLDEPFRKNFHHPPLEKAKYK